MTNTERAMILQMINTARIDAQEAQDTRDFATDSRSPVLLASAEKTLAVKLGALNALQDLADRLGVAH
jgi:hypothetical protein